MDIHYVNSYSVVTTTLWNLTHAVSVIAVSCVDSNPRFYMDSTVFIFFVDDTEDVSLDSTSCIKESTVGEAELHIVHVCAGGGFPTKKITEINKYPSQEKCLSVLKIIQVLNPLFWFFRHLRNKN